MKNPILAISEMTAHNLDKNSIKMHNRAMARHNTIKRILENIGLTPNEIRVYIAVLKYGSLSINEAARMTNIHRANIYEVIEILIKKHALYYEHDKGNKKIVFAHGPEKLRDILKRQQRTLQKASIKFEEIIPELKQMMKNPAPHSFVNCYRGIDGVKRVFLDTVTSSEDINGFAQIGHAFLLETGIPERWVKNVYRKRKLENNVSGNYICPDLDTAKRYLKETYEKEGILKASPEVKALGVKMKDTISFSEMVMYEDKVALISFDEKDKMGVVIKSPVLAKTFRVLFDGVWRMADKC